MYNLNYKDFYPKSFMHNTYFYPHANDSTDVKTDNLMERIYMFVQSQKIVCVIRSRVYRNVKRPHLWDQLFSVHFFCQKHGKNSAASKKMFMKISS